MVTYSNLVNARRTDIYYRKIDEIIEPSFLISNSSNYQKVSLLYRPRSELFMSFSSNSTWKPLIITGELTSSFLLGNGLMLAMYSSLDVNNHLEGYDQLLSYLIAEPLGTTCGTLLIGKLFDQNGSTKGTIIGSVIGTAIGCGGLFLVSSDREEYSAGFFTGYLLLAISPSIGSVIGYNIK